ncbi:unnamed protein product [Sphagnum troendelagicum]|uniref:Uncharacterized protein n=1 Tax=Sphagnum troendelagicum TaxID=128251 RepID=A0ABP0UC07_9BRYO
MDVDPGVVESSDAMEQQGNSMCGKSLEDEGAGQGVATVDLETWTFFRSSESKKKRKTLSPATVTATGNTGGHEDSKVTRSKKDCGNGQQKVQ